MVEAYLGGTMKAHFATIGVFILIFFVIWLIGTFPYVILTGFLLYYVITLYILVYRSVKEFF